MLGKHETYHSHNWLSIFVWHLQNGWHRRLIRHHSARDPICEKEDFEMRHRLQLKYYKLFSAAKYRRSPLNRHLCRHLSKSRRYGILPSRTYVLRNEGTNASTACPSKWGSIRRTSRRCRPTSCCGISVSASSHRPWVLSQHDLCLRLRFAASHPLPLATAPDL